jgi:hypothetical protein
MRALSRLNRSHLMSLGVFASFILIPLAAHAAVTGLTPIIPSTGVCSCPGSAPDWGCVLQTIQSTINDLIYLATVIITLFIALAGFTYMTSGGSAEKRQLANKRIMNAVIGLLIVLVAWLLVDSVMKVLYNQNSSFGPWNSILAGNKNDYCIVPKLKPAVSAFSQIGNTTNATGGSTLPPSTGSGSCDASTVQASAQAGGYSISASEAKTLACLAKPESTCGLNTSVSHSSSGVSSSASGPWQILVGAKDNCHSLNLPACGNLNCSTAYSGGHPKSDAASQALAQQCRAAANNLTCSSAAAACVVQLDGSSHPYSAWVGTGDGYSHSAQSACVANNAGS